MVHESILIPLNLSYLIQLFANPFLRKLLHSVQHLSFVKPLLGKLLLHSIQFFVNPLCMFIHSAHLFINPFLCKLLRFIFVKSIFAYIVAIQCFVNPLCILLHSIQVFANTFFLKLC